MLYSAIGPRRGFPIYIVPKFDFLEFLGHIQTHKITELMIVPPIVTALAKHPAARKADLSSVNYLTSGGAPLSSSLAREAETIWGGKLNIKVSPSAPPPPPTLTDSPTARLRND